METLKINNNESEFEPIKKLLLAIQNDPVINNKVSKVLKLDQYRRRFILNNWLEHLRIKKAPQNLLDSLSCLFDDKVSEQILEFISKHN